MAQGLFVVGFTVQEVLAILAVAKANLLNKVTQTSWTIGESSSGSVVSMATKEVLEECAYALQQLDPATYGKITRTVANFSGGLPGCNGFPPCR